MALSRSSHINLIESVEQETDVVSWINNALDATGDEIQYPTDLTRLEDKITQLLASLDIACEDTSSQLERTIEEVSRSVPRVAYDLHFMKDSAISLQGSVAKVRQQTSDAIPDTTSAALDHLRHLDMVKGRMEAAREALREAESWGSLESEVTSLLSERSYAKSAERLSEASRNMVVFQNTPEYESRRTLMVNLQNQLEASLSSALVAAINIQDTTACQSYFSIFSQIQRESEFRNYYNASRRASIVTLWGQASLSDCDSSTTTSAPTQTFADFLAEFYNSFLSLLQVEILTIPSVFPDPNSTLSTFISSAVSALQPSFSQRLSSLSEHYGETALIHLITILKTTEEFTRSAEKLFEKIGRPTSDDANEVASSPKPKPLARRRSTRMSISWRPGGQGMPSAPQRSLLPEIAEWKQELFQPFLDFQLDYGTRESNMLEHALRQVMTTDTTEKVQDADHARLLKERAVAVVSAAEESLSRCDAFTYGFGSMGLVQALDNFFKSFIELWTAHVRSQTGTTNSRTQNAASGQELADLDYTAQDWSDFQLLLHLLSSARVVFERISAFETKLRTTLTQTAIRFRLNRADLGMPTGTLHKGGSQLLEQSPLNSADLQTLLDTVEGDNQSRDPSLLSARHPHVLLMHESSEPLLIEARRAVFSFANSCQVSLQSMILSPLRNHLASYSSSPLWNATGDPKAKPKMTANDLHVPTFSLSPSESMQRVAEGLLNLPRLFEIYADDDALAFSLHTLPNVDPDLLKPTSQMPLEGSPQMRRSSFVAPSKPPVVMDADAVSSAWLSSLGHTLLLHFTVDILPSIASLSTAGAAQLTSDLEYLENIVSAINVEFPELKKWKEFVEMSEEDGRRRLSEVDGNDRVLQIVARWRGWSK